MMASEEFTNVSMADLFDQFIEATTLKNLLAVHRQILENSSLKPCEFNNYFPKLKGAIMTDRVRKNWKAKAIFAKIERRASHRCYSNAKTPTPLGNRVCDKNSSEVLSEESSLSSRIYQSNNNALQDYNCLIIGSGPAGLRTAIELQLLGASRVLVVEKRARFSRNNVLHLWPFVIDDLKSLGAKKFYGKFCAGSIDHISIRQLQLMLLKICLMIGVEFRESCSYQGLCSKSLSHQVRFNNNDSCEIEGQETNASLCDFDVIGSETPEMKPSSIKTCNVENQMTPQQTTAENITDSDGLVTSSSSKSCDQKKKENLKGARVHLKCEDREQDKQLHLVEWDIIIGADGRRNTLSRFFPRKEFRGRLAIAITANFINRQTPAEAAISEISGLSYIYNQDMFNALAFDTNIELENICYYKDDTHYFVMTAKKKSLLERGVLIEDHATTQDLLSEGNVNREALLQYARDAAYWTTGLEPLDFALNHYGKEDCAMFDFTSMYAALNACKALRTREGGLALIALVGDSLLEPFWPTGSGCARGFLSSFDAAWMCRQWAFNRCPVIDYHGSSSSSRNKDRLGDVSKEVELRTNNRMALSVIAERESIFRILAQTTSENLQQNYSKWTLNPHTRYPNLNRHHVLPSQVEHLIPNLDGKSEKGKVSDTARTRRLKSPTIPPNPRKSPKKLRSAGASPQGRYRNVVNRKGSNLRFKSKSRHDIDAHDAYRELERSYDFFNEQISPYRTTNRPNCDVYDDLFIPSISGTIPSSNNLLGLEARRARDIDECLRQRRQKTQLNVVRDQLIQKFKGGVAKNCETVKTPDSADESLALFRELKKLRELRAKARGDQANDIRGPLSLFNSMRRCASFAERVKTFENGLESESRSKTAKTPIESVKNKPEFTTLQEFFVNSSANNNEREPKRSKLPIMKLTKEDWNVKCWEERLLKRQQTVFKTNTIDKSLSVDSDRVKIVRNEKQDDIFKGRIKEMADRLKTTQDDVSPKGVCSKSDIRQDVSSNRGWVDHVRQELIKNVGGKKQCINQTMPSKPIKKLFEEDDDDDDGIDVNKHYDHLCVNRPVNKYLSRNNYTSHLMRTKYDKSRVISTKPTQESKQAYMASLTSRGSSSASSTISERSVGAPGNPNSSNEKVKQSIQCFRCSLIIDPAEKITVEHCNLHRACLNCSSCAITLRTNEIRYYIDSIKEGSAINGNNAFCCAICRPAIRAAHGTGPTAGTDFLEINSDKQSSLVEHRLQSRERFMMTKVNYNEIYKSILSNHNLLLDEAATRIERLNSNHAEPLSSELAKMRFSKEGSNSFRKVTPSPVQVTLPSRLLRGAADSTSKIGRGLSDQPDSDYRVADSEIIDGEEQVTLILPSQEEIACSIGHDEGSDSSSEMMDEDEINRLLHLDCVSTKISTKARQSNAKENGEQSENSGNSSNNEVDDDKEHHISESDTEAQGVPEDVAENDSDEPSSLNSPLSISDESADEDEDSDDNRNRNSTYADFLTSEELGTVSDPEQLNEGNALNQAPTPVDDQSHVVA